MKKTISLLLALVMCLSLCACGNKNTDTPTEGVSNNSEADSALLGQWVSVEDRIHSFLFTEDKQGAASNDKREAPIEWFYDVETNNYVITVLDEDTFSIRLEVIEGFDSFTYDAHTFIRIDEYDAFIAKNTESADTEETTKTTSAVDEGSTTEVQEETKAPVIVELTLDNWSEYLEFTSRYEPSVNGFNEVDDVKFYFDICLKEDYLETLDTKNSTITVEISFARGTQYGTFSEDFKTFIPDGEYDKWEGAEKTEIYDFSMGSYGFGACYTLASADFENGSFGPFYPSEQEVLRVSGTLVFN